MRWFKPKNSADCYKLGGESKYSYSNRKKPMRGYTSKNRKLIKEYEEMVEKNSKIPKGRWFD